MLSAPTLTPAPAILSTLRAFICQRPGFEPRNYISAWNDTEGRRAYRADVRRAGQDRRDALALLAFIERSAAYDPAVLSDLSDAASRGRLTWNGTAWEYCAGQYYPVEYRRAAVRVLSDAIIASNARTHNLTLPQVRRNVANRFGRGLALRCFA
jgi:hypothetical protein